MDPNQPTVENANLWGENNNHQGVVNSFSSSLVDFIQTAVVFAAIAVLIHLFIAQPHRVSGSSMVPTFHDGDFILTEKISYKLGDPQKGDVIVFKSPENEAHDFIKRVIAVPGDTVRVQDGGVYVNNEKVPEEYLPLNTFTAPAEFLKEGSDVKIESNNYIVFGDNRAKSSDSRVWGPVTKDKIVGKAFFRYWPLNAFGIFRSGL